MDKNQGYEIIKAVMLENGRGFALGHHPTAPSPYVTWACYDDKDGQRQYEWGHYGSDRAALELYGGLCGALAGVPAPLRRGCMSASSKPGHCGTLQQDYLPSAPVDIGTFPSRPQRPG